jgi:hypothetical protein
MVESRGRGHQVEPWQPKKQISRSLQNQKHTTTGPKREQGLLLVSDELVEELPIEQLMQCIDQSLPTVSFADAVVAYDPHDETMILEKIKGKTNISSLALLQEGWQPPIEEVLSFLRLIRAEMGDNVTIYIVLTGKPDRENILSEVTELDYTIWKDKLTVLKDQSLEIVAVRCK